VSSEQRCAACAAALDPERFARCDVCEGARLCLGCATAHLCSERCRSNGCVAGLCVRMVRGGVTDARFGVFES
jgi:hypothetical protein